MGVFNEFISNKGVEGRLLPICHICEGYDFRKIIRDEKLATSLCDKFNEKLLYFFYGRPSYRVAKNQDATSLSSFYPICFVLDTSKIPVPKRIFPFDSGAFKNKLFSDFFHPKMNIEDFALEPNMNMPSKLISIFYQSNSNYLKGIGGNKIDHDPLMFEIECYLKLVTSNGNSKVDNRKDTIEIQVDNPIKFTTDVIKMVALPAPFLDDHAVLHALNKWNIDFEVYETFRSNPNDFQGAIFMSVLKYIGENHLL